MSCSVGISSFGDIWSLLQNAMQLGRIDALKFRVSVCHVPVSHGALGCV
jgi:hypothetical protein